MNVCALGGKERGGLCLEMKVERNKRFGFNLVEEKGLPCPHWLKASRSLRKDCDKSSVRKSNGTVQFDNNARPGVVFNTLQGKIKSCQMRILLSSYYVLKLSDKNKPKTVNKRDKSVRNSIKSLFLCLSIINYRLSPTATFFTAALQLPTGRKSTGVCLKSELFFPYLVFMNELCHFFLEQSINQGRTGPIGVPE